MKSKILFLCWIGLALPAFGQTGSGPTAKALAILQQNCGSSGCHGGPDAYSFDVRDPASLIAAGVVEPGNAAGSEIIRRVEAGIMPLGGYQGRPGARLPAEDILALRGWIDGLGVGSVSHPQHARRPFMRESEVLQAIRRDLDGAGGAERPYLRYFTLANLWNNADVQDDELKSYNVALGKLLNHLSWGRDIVLPKPIGLEGVVLRIDIRDYGWTTAMWDSVVASYPYTALDADDLLSVRADWFIAAASKPPLYHVLLQLPEDLSALEAMLHIDGAFDVQQNFARRFGVRNSGVSRNNRAMERHASIYGAYWKSFDFAANQEGRNIFRDPLDFRPDGGEIIFSLPNGLQGYFIVNRQGRRIDEAPADIVRDRTNLDDPVVRTGRSCIGCHVSGMNAFRDEIRTTLDSRSEALFDLERARSLYPGQAELDGLLASDAVRFTDAVRRTGGAASAAGDEIINRLARKYEAGVSPAQAAAELDLEDPNFLLRIISSAPDLQFEGFDQFLGPRGGMKRDAWEQGFRRISSLTHAIHRRDAESKKPAA